MTIWTLARKEFRLLLRDRLASLMLVVMPLLFILILGLLLGEAFGQKPDDRIRIILVDRDAGPGDPAVAATWARAVRDDLSDTADIRIEMLDSAEEAESLVKQHRQAAVIVFGPQFSEQINNCSFTQEGINPFYRDGVLLDTIGVTLLKDPNQPGQAAIIEQVAQVSLLRVIMPFMIAKAFNKLSDVEFIKILGDRVNLPVPPRFKQLGKDLGPAAAFLPREFKELMAKDKMTLNESLEFAAEKKPEVLENYRKRVGTGVQEALDRQFSKYDLTGKTWAKLTKSREEREGGEAKVAEYRNRNGSGLLNRGAVRYQILVPSYTVMFAFFLVMTVGWMFVSERRQGTLRRLQAAPLTRTEILAGKLLPCFVLSVVQGVLLLLAGKLVFGMSWGPEDWSLPVQVLSLLPVVLATSLAAMGLAMLVATLARTEIQVALYGAVPVLALALIGGCLLPPDMMPESVKWVRWITPQGWALEAYGQMLNRTPGHVPNMDLVWAACGALAGFGSAFVALAWWLLPLD